MLSLSLPCAQHTRHLNSCQSGRHCRDQCSVAFCQAITTLHQQPCHLSPPTHTYVPLCHCAFTTLDCLCRWLCFRMDLLTIVCYERTDMKKTTVSFFSLPFLTTSHGSSCIWVKVGCVVIMTSERWILPMDIAYGI